MFSFLLYFFVLFDVYFVYIFVEQQVPVHLRGRAAECILFEAATRMKDPVYGSVGIISQLQQQITQVQNEILKIQGEIALQKVYQHQQEDQTMMHLQQLGASSEVGPDFGLQLHTVNGSSNLEVASDQPYDFGGDLHNNHFSTDFNG